MGATATTPPTTFLTHLKVLFLTVAIFLLSITFLPILSLIFWFYKRIVHLLARLFRPDLHNFVDGVSNICALDDIYRTPKVNLLGFVKMDSLMDIQAFRALFEQRIMNLVVGKGDLKYPELRQTWTSFLGYYFWKWDRNFRLDSHIRAYDYTGSELNLSEVSTDEDLRRIMGPLMALPWTPGKSAWEMLFIDNFQPETGSSNRTTVIAFRLHHTLGDGYSFLKLFLQDLAGVTNGVPKPSFPRTSFCSQLISTLSLPLTIPYQLADEAVKSSDSKNAWHLTDTKLSRQYHTAMTSAIPTETIKQIRKKHGANYNAVLCAALAGGIRRVMTSAGQEVPDSISCMIPIPLPNHPGGLVIHAASVFTRLPLTPQSPAQRLQAIDNTMKKSKVPAHLIGQYLLMKYVGLAPIIHNRLFRNKIASTLALSCFPGPEESPMILGAKMTDVMVGCGLGAGKTGAFVILFSVSGKQRFVINIDRTVFPSEQLFSHLGDFVEQELEILQKTEPLDKPTILQNPVDMV